ncbi:MAG: alpha-amylase family glycosyl hydrolase [Flavitalea sp.]
MKNYLFILFAFLGLQSFAQTKSYPTHWWIGMKNPKLQIMLRSTEGLPAKASLNYPGVKLVKSYQPSNKNYLFLDLEITNAAKAGTINIKVGNSIVPYQLKKREPGSGITRNKGITPADLIYLIMPDRFSNGDPSNDKIAGLKDQSLNRDSIYHRHGGDLKGIENHLDYLQDLGVTSLWLNPVIENDMPERTEHGYAFTDHYAVDKRIGGNEAYKSLSNALHKRNMTLIQDAVYNHVGIEHFLYRDLPDSTWFHFWPSYTQTNYREQPMFDPHGAKVDEKRVTDGWFVPSMPDINQKNPYFANFLIQHAIWSTEEFGLDGWRIDTYIYNDLAFMNKCNKALIDQYPKIYLFGETWVHGVINQAFFTKTKVDFKFKSNLPGVTDFQTNMYGINLALNQPAGWTEGVNRLHQTVAQDVIYQDPMNHVIFLDNHDMTRFYSTVGEDAQKLKMGYSWLLTFRGIPQMYYGSEVGMKGISNPDGWVRLDFPGGFQGDKENKFIDDGRNASEKEIFNHIKKLANFRKNSSAIKSGKMMQFVPEGNLYVYFRYDKNQTVMCILNAGNEEASIDMKKFAEISSGFSKGIDVVSGNEITLEGMKAPAKNLIVLELKK